MSFNNVDVYIKLFHTRYTCIYKSISLSLSYILEDKIYMFET